MIWALAAAVVIGLSLGILGFGGSILTVPVLVYILGHPEKVAIAESLAIVGIIATSGAIFYGLRKQIDWKIVVYFGFPGILGAYLGSHFSFYLSGSMQMFLFSLILLFAGNLILFSPAQWNEIKISQEPLRVLSILQGFSVGCLTGLLGCGGGFIIVPALLLFNHVNMATAVGSGLAIVSINAFSGLKSHLASLEKSGLEVEWNIILLLSVIGICGSMSGAIIAKFVSTHHIKQAFALSLVLVGVLVFIKQFN